ncbi:MAG: IPExxxVDY family protein [Sporocytophaga sp.]|nr:IPExxxVDY family protein [Sporocytophaga sp.]
MMKTTKLVVDYEYDFEFFAIISSVKAHKLAWSINKVLNINLCKQEDIKLDFIKDWKLVITNYIYEKEYSVFRLLKNRSCESENLPKPFLVPELKEYDYFIHMSGEVMLFETAELFEKLKELQIVQYVKKIEVNKLKSKENLIF